MTERYALIVVDAIRAFFAPEGYAFYPEALDVLPNMQRLLAAARGSGTFVVHAVERHHAGVIDDEHKRLPVHCEIGSPEAEYVAEMAPRLSASEIEVAKIRFSAFLGTELDLMLRAQRVTAVVITGVKANVCIRATAQDAFGLGYRVLVPRDATNSNRPHLGAASLEDISRYMGSTPTTEEALALLGSPVS